tara:strand:- start:334 stop:603 length:270 start_codon:yes stop_codon:yes gene_type:complete
MTGKLKILSLSKDIAGLKAKRSYTDANIHFRDLNSHTLTLKNKKEYILCITATSIEAESLMIEGDVWTNGEEEWRAGTIFEFRFWPFCK